MSTQEQSVDVAVQEQSVDVGVRELMRTVEMLATVVPTKPRSSAYDYVRLAGDTVAAANEDMTVAVSGVPTGSLAVCLHHKQLRGALAQVLRACVTVRIVVGDAKHVFIVAAGMRMAVDALPIDEFPSRAVTAEGTALEHSIVLLDGDALVRALSAVAPYATRDTGSQSFALTTVCLTLGDSAEAAATDSFRLAYQGVPRLPGAGWLLIPTQMVKALNRAWKHVPVAQREPVLVEYSRNCLSLTFGDVRIVSTLLVATYPDYHAVLEREGVPGREPSLTVQGDVLGSALASAARCAKLAGAEPIVRLSWTEGTLRLWVTGDVGIVYDGNVPAQCLREGKVALRSVYMAEYLALVRDGAVTIAVGALSEAVLFLCDGAPRVVIMPISVRW